MEFIWHNWKQFWIVLFNWVEQSFAFLILNVRISNVPHNKKWCFVVMKFISHDLKQFLIFLFKKVMKHNSVENHITFLWVKNFPLLKEREFIALACYDNHVVNSFRSNIKWQICSKVHLKFILVLAINNQIKYQKQQCQNHGLLCSFYRMRNFFFLQSVQKILTWIA